ncbi:MAG: YlmC/YmxH family sporulation protein [Actinomycetia bacterium]|jgi:YlmC/YmxH family sporulation protein|nr:YlmC/YmxH family sporulation protein [Actinomycetes bacterium]
MSAIRVSELRQKDVVNVADGRRLGLISDLELDLEAGRVTALVIAGPARLFGLLGRERDVVIPWPAIQKIGQDVILVRLEASG